MDIIFSMAVYRQCPRSPLSFHARVTFTIAIIVQRMNFADRLLANNVPGPLYNGTIGDTATREVTTMIIKSGER